MVSVEDLRNNVVRSFDIVKLRHEDSVNQFDCGDDDLNDFILNESELYRKALLAVSYILVDREHGDDVIAYFSLANDKVSIADFEDRSAFNRFRKRRFVNEKRLKSYPAAKICRLAVDLTMKGRLIGTFLLNFIKSYFIPPC